MTIVIFKFRSGWTPTPLIISPSSSAKNSNCDAAATFDETRGSSDDPNDPNHLNDGACARSGSMSRSGSFVRFDATWKNGDERDVFVEGTACACDPNDPGDCCARGLSEYCTTCPTLASCDESLDGLGSDGLTAGSGASSSVDRDRFPYPSPLRSTDALESLEFLRAACAAATRTGDCAFSEAIKDEVSRKGERPENAGRTYYAAVVRTRDVGRSDDEDASLESAWNATDPSAFSAAALADAGYEQFLVYRPNGDAWLAGSVPPPTTVRRASFGPKLRAELWSLAKRGGR